MSINNKRSYTEYTVTQPTTDFAIGFDDFDEGGKDNILVTLNGVLVESLGYAAIRKNESTVSITPAITEGTVRLTRETDIDEPFHKFTAGALFSAKSMDENFQQVRHSQQEVRDGFVFLEYNTNGIVQASKEATAQAKAATVEATASAVRAETAADTAVQAVGSLQGVVDAATTATSKANTATATATTAASQATAATTSAQNAAQAANTAKQEAAAAAANANAATVDSLAATGRANDAADVVADLVVGKVRAQDVSTADSSTQAEVNKKTVYEYDTVATMLADTFISIGKVVSTNGYYTKRDGGGAKYEISSTATNYSIPLANGLHAVFNDTFDIRKFGIVDSKTKDQDAELARMRNYADTRIYSLDFHNFWIRASKEYKEGVVKTNTRGLWFEEAHEFKNLKLVNDKTVRLETGQNLLIFCPKKSPDVETWVKFDNVVLDPWVDNYQPFTDNYDQYYDGQRHGILCHPIAPEFGGEFNAWGGYTNFSFSFKDINFISPAYSYNISTSAINAPKVTVENMKGQFAGLAFNYQAYDLIARNINMTRRKDLIEVGRPMVNILLHHEPELGYLTRTFNSVYLENVTGVRSDGEPLGIHKFSPVGTKQTLNSLVAINCDGQIVFEGRNAECKSFTRIGGKYVTNVFFNTSIRSVLLKDLIVTAWPASEIGIPASPVSGNTRVTTMDIDNCDIVDSLFYAYVEGGRIDYLTIKDSTIKTHITEPILVNNPSNIIDNITLRNVTTACNSLLHCQNTAMTVYSSNFTNGGSGSVGSFMKFAAGQIAHVYLYDCAFNANQLGTENTFSGEFLINVYGGHEVKSRMTYSSTNPYHYVNIVGMSSKLYSTVTTVGVGTVPTAGSFRKRIDSLIEPNMKTITVRFKGFIDGLSITPTVVGGVLFIDIFNTTTSDIILNPESELIITQTL